MHRLLIALLPLFVLAEPRVQPGTMPPPKGHNRAHLSGGSTTEVPAAPASFRPGWVVRSSQAAFLAGRVADSLSTPWGRPGEMNPLLRGADGSYGAKGLGVQIGISAAWLAGQELILRKWGHAKWVRQTIAVMNFGGAGIGFGAAAHNWRAR